MINACMKAAICAAVGLAGLALGRGSFATESTQEIGECIKRPVAFDGVDELRYYVVRTKAGATPVLSSSPVGCTGAIRNAPCAGEIALNDGDIVAVGKICDAKAFGQYIGTTSVAAGWTDTNSLEPIGNRKVLKKGTHNPKWPAFNFKLTKGAGVPVCAAYLQRLNVTNYENNAPYCDRGEDDVVEGFEALHRVYLDAAEISAWSRRIWNFETGECPSSEEHCNKRRRGHVAINKDLATAMQRDNALSVWKYQPELDIENRGEPKGLLVWYGAGLLRDRPYVCGGGLRDLVATGLPKSQHVYILDSTRDRIEDQKTLSIFGQAGATWEHGSAAAGHPGDKFLGENIQPFSFRGVYYFDAAVVNEKVDGVTPSELDVYERSQDKTDLVCEVEMTPHVEQR